MTHSIASAKCPNVLSSGNYGMSQNRYTDDSKEYIFVKFTDSAFRAIEEYQRNENAKRFAPGQRAKIQFVGNSGVIHFPLPDASNGNVADNGGAIEPAGRKFGFAIDDIEGSLECIQQQEQDLDVLGPLALRMRIHANDDVYTTTRTKMAIAEETEKSKCIREIKPNQSDIGRKVKKTSSSAAAFQQQHSGNSNNNNSGSSSSYLSSSNSRSKLVSSPLNGLASTSFTSSRSPNPTNLGGSGTISSGGGLGSSNGSSSRYGGSSNIYSQQQQHHNNNYNSSSNHSLSSSSLPNLTSASSLSSTFAGGISHGYASLSGSSPRESSALSLMTGGGGNSAANRAKMGNSSSYGNGARGFANSKSSFGIGVNNVKGSAGGNSNANGSGKMSDVSRRKIRERLIHLLALKPFKKPELHARLRNEGIRDRERSTISNILKDISTMSRDNTYNLRRQIWNDVDENWPFFTEQELQQLKRRKPQNLTPPMSSDAGSSTSGQSPTSTHTGSPPPLVGNGSNGGNNMMLGGGIGMGSLSNSGLSNLKRPSLEYDDSMFSGVQAKKQRISHYKKESSSSGGGGNGNANNLSTGARSGGSYPNSRGPNSSFSPHSNNIASHHQQQQQQQQLVHPSSMVGDDYSTGNSDLSYNVLDNMDGFMSHVEQQSNSNGSYFNANAANTKNTTNSKSRKSSSSSGKDNGKEKRNSGGSNSSSSIGYETQERKQSAMPTAQTATGKKAASNKSAYVNSFVPELSKSSSCSNIRGSNYAQQSPPAALSSISSSTTTTTTMSKKKNSNSSVIYPSQSSPHDEYNSTYHHSVSNSKKRTSSHSGGGASGQRQQSSRAAVSSNSSSSLSTLPTSLSSTASASTSSSSSSSSSSSLSNKQQQHQNQQQSSMSSSSSLAYQKVPPPSESTQALTQIQPPQTQRQYPSPTQQLAAAAHSYGSAASMAENVKSHLYDFSNYTPIMTLEQRRRLKTEFENDYDEYCKLLSLVENVRKRFQELAERLENASRHDTGDYNSIREQILSEYYQLNKKETIHRDKARFDYLHAKLAHIKQLVTDYDDLLTKNSSENNDAASSQAIILASTMPQQSASDHLQQHHHHHLQQQQQEQQQQHQQLGYGQTLPVQFAQQSTARLSPMVHVKESNNYSPSLAQYQQQQQQQQQQMQPRYEQHHAAETIAQHSNMSASQHYNAQEQLLLQHQQPQQQYHNQSYYNDNGEQSSSSNNNNINNRYHQEQNGNGVNKNNDNNHNHNDHNNHGNDSDSDDSSESSDSNEDDGEDTNSNSNSDDDEDEDNDHY